MQCGCVTESTVCVSGGCIKCSGVSQRVVCGCIMCSVGAPHEHPSIVPIIGM